MWRLLDSKLHIRCAIRASSRSCLFGTAVNGRTELFVQGDPARLAGCAGEVATDLEACEHGLVVVVAVVVVVVFFVLRETC